MSCFICLSFSADTQNNNLPAHGPSKLAPGLILCATCTIFETEPFPGPGPAMGPGGPKIGRQSLTRIDRPIFPKICPRWECTRNTKSAGSTREHPRVATPRSTKLAV